MYFWNNGIIYSMDILSTNKPYNCYCGTGEAMRFVSSLIFEGYKSNPDTAKIAIVTDRIVSGYYYNRFEEQFLERGVKPVLIPVECSEENKSLKEAESVYEYLVDFRFGSNDWLIALGGGSIIDVAGFCASVFEGGINFIAVPTTPDSMYGSAVADKVFLNSKRFKNVISSPFSPVAAVIDPDFLKTVPDKIKHNGYADIVRLAVLADLNLLVELVSKKNNREFLNHVYAIRNTVISASPKLLTLGNEIASAIEGYFRFMNYSEGEALALSLFCCVDPKNRVPLAKIYETLGLPTKLDGVSTKSIMKIIKENFSRSSGQMVELVDMTSEQNKRWTVKKVTTSEAEQILCNRLQVIDPGNEGVNS
jgi:3-dehydroquinate synthetase